jgi:hypothetical protein
MNPISFSRAELVATCPAAAVIPWVDEIYDALNGEEEPEPRREGTVAHRFLELVSGHRADGKDTEGARALALAEVPDADRPIAAVLDLDHLPVDLRAEVAFAWDWRARRGRLLGQGLGRRYHALPSGIAPLGPTEVPGTVDVLGLGEGGVVLVGDYKRGRTRYPRPGELLQTVLGGLAACDVFGADRAVLDLHYLREDGQHFTVRDELDAWDLEIGAARFARAMDAAVAMEPLAAAGATLPLVTGRHCRYCPARKNCNATTALVRELPERFEGILKEGRWNDLALDRRARRYHLLVGLKSLVDDLLGEAYIDAAAHPVDLGDGTVLRAEPYEREKLVGDAAFPIYAAMFGREAAERASKRTMSWEAARAEIAATRKPGEKIETKAGDGLLDRFRREVRARNATNYERGETVRVVKIKK